MSKKITIDANKVAKIALKEALSMTTALKNIKEPISVHIINFKPSMAKWR
jgi:hypothetical protein